MAGAHQCQVLVWTEPLSELKPQLCSLLPEVCGGSLSHLHILRWNSVFLVRLFRAWSSTWYIINVPGGKRTPKHPNWLHPRNNFSCHWAVSLSRVGFCVCPFPYSNQGWQGRWWDATDFLILFTFWDCSYSRSEPDICISTECLPHRDPEPAHNWLYNIYLHANVKHHECFFFLNPFLKTASSLVQANLELAM